MTVFPAEKPILPQSEDNPWDDPGLAAKIGKFRIPRKAELAYGFNFLHRIQSSCIIKFMEAEWHRNDFTVYALSPAFEAVPEGNIVPWYHLIIEDKGDEPANFRFEPVEDERDYGAVRYECF